MTSGATRVLDLIQWSGTITTYSGGWVVAGQDVAFDGVLTVLVGPDVTLPAPALTACASFGVTIIVCDWRGTPISATHPWSKNSDTGRRMRAQAAMTRPRQKNAWMRLVKAKIINQARCLDHHHHDGSDLRRLAATVTSGDPRNVEAQAARIYWPTLMGHWFRRRGRTREGTNAALDYGYAILRGAVLREIVAAGLNPALGLHHRGPSSPFNLADDLMEPFRPVVDSHVVDLRVEDDLGVEAKHSLVDHITTAPLWTSPNGRATTPTAVRLFAQQVAAYALAENVKYLHPPHLAAA